jgi:four helix bundle protein
MEHVKKARSFEDLEVWKEGCDLAEAIYREAREGELRRDYGFRDQLTRAAISIPANIAEGKERQTVPELIRYLYIAKGFGGELRTQIHIAQRIGYFDQTTSQNLSERMTILSKKLGSFFEYSDNKI